VLAPVAFETIDIDLASAASLGERQERIGRALVAAAQPDHEVAARLRVSGAGSLAAKASLAQQLAEAACEEVTASTSKRVASCFPRSGSRPASSPKWQR
jgi:hypothetical protein